MGSVVMKIIKDYKDGQEDSLQEGWDYVQFQVRWGRAGQREVPGQCVSVRLGLVTHVPACAWQREHVSEFGSVYLMGAGLLSSPPTWHPSHHHRSLLRGPRVLEVALWLTVCPSVARDGGVSSRPSHLKPGR